MLKQNCERIKYILESIFSVNVSNVVLKINIIDKYSKGGNRFYRMRIRINKKYSHLLKHIYTTAYAICALTGEYLDKQKIKKTKDGDFLYLS